MESFQKNTDPEHTKQQEITPLTLLHEADLEDKKVLSKYREITRGFLTLTVENIEAFGNYVEKRIDYYRTQGISHPLIVEVGAGNGRLTHFLTEKLHNDNYYYDIIPTDDFSWGKTKIVTDKTAIPQLANVAHYNHKEAMQAFEPTIVICSMMTPAEDLSREFRKMPSVQEYILLGHRMGTGHQWETHGEYFYKHKITDKEFIPQGEPQYKIEGFERFEIEEVSETFVRNKRNFLVEGNIPTEDDKEYLRGTWVRCDSFRRIRAETSK